MSANADAPWAFAVHRRRPSAGECAARGDGDAHRKEQEVVEAEIVKRDRKIVADVSARRVAKHKPPLTPEQEQTMLDERAAQRAQDT